jgi:hypothetical protein
VISLLFHRRSREQNGDNGDGARRADLGKGLRTAGETEQRLYLLDGWREAPFYSERERAALAWAEAVTRVTEGHVSDEVFKEARSQFSEEELANLTLAVVAINGWNRLSIAFRAVPGTYQPQAQQAAPEKMAA